MSNVFGSEALARWGLLDLVQREQRRDALMASVPMPAPALLEVLRSQWSASHGEAAHLWCARLGTQPADFDALVARQWRWEAWCEQRFAASLVSTFLRRKAGLDQVCFWQLDVQDADLAAELYLRLREGEASMPQLDAQRCGPVSMEQLPVQLRTVLQGMQVGDVSAPKPVGDGFRLLHLEQKQPAVLTDSMRRSLLLELGEHVLSRSETDPSRAAN